MFAFLQMSFGLINVGETFQRAMEITFCGLLDIA